MDFHREMEICQEKTAEELVGLLESGLFQALMSGVRQNRSAFVDKVDFAIWKTAHTNRICDIGILFHRTIYEVNQRKRYMITNSTLAAGYNICQDR